MSKLDLAGIQQPLTELATSRLEKLEVFSSIASTNTYLMSQPAPGAGRYRVAIADQQTSGRGRHFRRWVSAPGAGLYMSLSYTFTRPGRDLGGLTLAIGVGIIHALQQLDVDGLSLKWPNDIVALDGKLGGILTEMQSGRSENATVVTGVGLNVVLPDRLDLGASSRWLHQPIGLESVVDEPPARELIAGTIIEQLYLTFLRFEEYGLAEFMDDWRRHDWLLGREVTVDLPDSQIAGVAAGVGADGSLYVDTSDGRVTVVSGSVAIVGPKQANE